VKATSLLIASVTFAVSAFAADDREQNVSLDQIPAPAAQAIQKLGGGAKPEKVSKESDKGKVAFEATFGKGGHRREATGKREEIVITPDSKVIEREDKSHDKDNN